MVSTVPKYIASEIRTAEGFWLNSQVFRGEALKFMKNGYYCSDPYGSPGFIDYWTEQLRRCKEGYDVDGVKITGHHYEYLNFTQIEVVEKVKGTKASKKMTKMPDFWDGDYDYFWSLEIAKNGLTTADSLVNTTLEEREEWNSLDARIEEISMTHVGKLEDNLEWVAAKERRDEISLQILARLGLGVKPHLDYLGGGYHMIVGKSRRKGYSYKNASICANIYNTTRKSLTLIGAFDKKYLYPEGTMGMVSKCLTFLNKHTAWAKAREYVDKQEHKRASFQEVREGVKMESGYMSQVMAITFADNPEAARGKDALMVIMEEAGAFPNLKAAFLATAPGLTAGKYITGQIVIFGTGGDMEVGTVDFADMFYNPMQFGLMPFMNIWDENAENTYCGFFHPVYMNMEGYYDEQGNSDTEAAIAAEKRTREKIRRASTSSLVLQQRVQEWPLCPSEAFLTVSVNDFPVVELRAQYNRVIRENLHLKKGTKVYLTHEVRTELVNNEQKPVKKVVAKVDLDDLIDPIWDYKVKNKDLKGGVIIYEPPVLNSPKGLYKIGFDPYRQQSSNSSQPSLAAIYVYKSTDKFSYTRNTIVAQYVGRPYNPDDVNRIAEMLAELYNAEIMHENEVTHVKSYFERKKKLHLLAAQPDAVISKNIKASTVARTYGIHMVDKLKDAGEKYLKQWLLEIRDYDENGDAVYNLETIYDPALLEELILYNRKGNFDRVMAFMMVMFQCAEEDEGKEYDSSKTKVHGNAHDLLEMMNKQFKKN